MTRRTKRRRFWTASELSDLRRLYPSHSAAEIGAGLGRPASAVAAKAHQLGLRKSREWIAERARARMADPEHGARTTQSRRGQPSWNKGLKGWRAGGRSAETRFRPGDVSARWDPEVYCIGALRINSYGDIDIKLREGLRGWDSLRRYTWQMVHGPIPAGMSVTAINGDPHDTRPANLRLATRAELMRRNTVHNYGPEIFRAVQLVGALKRQINRRIRHAQE